MSWMDSWSRPAKTQATPAPYYLLPGGEATPYCHSCGRVISTRRQTSGTQHQKENKKAATVVVDTVKYCSSRCRNRKPGKLDREIERVFLQFLLGKEKDEKKEKDKKNMDGKEEAAEAGITKTTPAEKAAKPANKGHGRGYQKYHQKEGRVKGDARLLVSCGMVEDEVFPHHREHAARDNEEQRPGTSCSSRSRSSSGSSHGSQAGDDRAHAQEQGSDRDDHSNHDSQPHCEEPLHHDLDSYDALLHPPHHHHHHENNEIDGDVLARLSVRSGTRVRPPQSVSQVNGSVGGEKGRAERLDESAASLQKRLAGQRRAREREMVRCAARRGVAFGFVVGAPEDDMDAVHHQQQQQQQQQEELEEGGSGKGGKKHQKKKQHAKKSSLGSNNGAHDGEEKQGREKGARRFCEAVMNGKVVEPSFAKGNWSIRWREE